MDRAEAITYWEGLHKTFSSQLEKEENHFGRMHLQYTLDVLDTTLAALREQDATDINVGNKWISVEERLPDKDALVLCIGAKGGMFLGFIRSYYECQNGAYTYVPNSRGCRYTTHWMPLPEPPKEGAEG